jgi:hypothetical protein
MTRNYKNIVQEFELQLMSPEAVAAFLRDRVDQNIDNYLEFIDVETEEALVGRSDPLIDFALARYAHYTPALHILFTRPQASTAIRLAILSNCASHDDDLFPYSVLGWDKEVHAWLANAPLEELNALFENPSIGCDFLTAVLDGREKWAEIPDDRLSMIVMILSRNKMLYAIHENTECLQQTLETAWQLADKVHPTKTWAESLASLYARLAPWGYIKNLQESVSRWRINSSSIELVRDEALKNSKSLLSGYQGVRKGLARLALRFPDTQNLSKRMNLQFLESDDLALRAAVYSEGILTPEQLEIAYKRDGKFVFIQGQNNLAIWHNSECRNILFRAASDSDDIANVLNANKVKNRAIWL